LNKKRILICSSNEIGKKIYNLLKENYECSIYTSEEKYKNKLTAFVKNKEKFLLNLKKEKKFDFIILIFWPYVIDYKYFYKFKNSINFHPSYLPFHRGWYPHVHAKITNKKWGVSLHQIDKGIDTGKIWVQKKINIHLLKSNKEIYNIAKKELFILFKQNYKKIIEEKINPSKQKIKTKFLNKKDVLKYDNLNLKKKYKLENFINLCLARQWGTKTFLKFKFNKEYYKIFLKVNKIDQ